MEMTIKHFNNALNVWWTTMMDHIFVSLFLWSVKHCRRLPLQQRSQSFRLVDLRNNRLALLVENKRENSSSPVLSVVPVVQSFMQQHNRISQEVRKQVHLLCCEYVLAHACRPDDPTFADKSKTLAAEDTNLQSILFSSPPSQLTVPFHRTMEALIAFNWYRCDTKPNLEITDHTVMSVKASGNQRYTASAVWCLGMTYYRLGNFSASYNHMLEAYQLFNNLPPGEVESQRLGCLCGVDLVENARFILQAHKVVSLARDVEKKVRCPVRWHYTCIQFVKARDRSQQCSTTTGGLVLHGSC